MPQYRTLVIAPKNDLLLVTDEVMQVVNALGAQLLQGTQATLHGLLEMVNKPFDIIWFATHGDEKGVYLNDGILNTSEITTLARSTSTSLVVLNTCSSRNIALAIYDELRIQLICTVKPVPDRSAFITGTIFARRLADGLSYREAYESAKPGQNVNYVFLPERELEMPPLEREARPNQRVEDDLTAIKELVKKLEVKVSGDMDGYGVQGLIPTVRILDDKVDKLIIDFTFMRNAQQTDRKILLTITIVCIALMIAMLFLFFRGLLV